VSTLNFITAYAGTDANVTGVFNITTFTGGADAEAISTTKILAPMLLKTRDRFVTIADGIALTLANTISGNGDDGLQIELATTTGNVVQGNRIGSNLAGTAPVGNTSSGVCGRPSSEAASAAPKWARARAA
jgi:hypothetical protein